MNNFTIDSLAWYPPGSTSYDMKARFKTLVTFLEDNRLTKKVLCDPDGDIPADFRLSADDLTSEGIDFMRLVYPKWVQRVDRGASPTDKEYLEKALKKMRS